MRTLVVPGVARPWHVAADADWVYYTEIAAIAAGECNAAVKRVSRAGQNSPEILLSGLQEPGPLFIANNRLYVSDVIPGGSLYAIKLDDSPPTVTELIVDRDFPFDIFVDSDGVLYYTTGAGVERFEPGSGLPTVIHPLEIALGVVLDDTRLYVLSLERDTGSVLRMKKDGSDPEILVSGLIRPFLPVLNEGSLYFAEFSPDVSGDPPDGRIIRIDNVATCGFPCPLTKLAINLNGPRRVAVDSASVYFSEVWGGRIRKVDKLLGGTPTTLASRLEQPMDLALWDGIIYFGELGADVSCCF